MDRGAWRATIHGIAKSRTRLSTHAYNIYIKKKQLAETAESICLLPPPPSPLIPIPIL